ncbi:MAG: ABC transporter permease [Chloroflexi bacterium]|nr:ABC transporter permease [Chloroflexota bacterium]
MRTYAVRRFLQSIPLLFVISIILFALMYSIGDPLAIVMNVPRRPSGQQLEQAARRMGLDQPIPVQYVYWLIGNDWTYVDVNGDGTTDEQVRGTRRGILRGDLGTSMVTRQPVQDRIGERLTNTLILMVPAYLLILMVSFVLGLISALRQYTLLDSILSTLAFVFYSMPIFMISLGMILIFAVAFRNWGLPYLPIAGMGRPGEARTIANLLPYMIMPLISLTLISAAAYMRYVRANVLEIINQDYVRTARAKGLSERRVLSIHVLRNAALPLVTIIGLDLPFLLGGAIVTESIFAWPGMGLLFIESLERSDYPVLMAMLMMLAVFVVLSQLITDLLYSVLDPRIRLS